MSKLWSPLARRLTPYVPGEQPHSQRVLKLNTNENAYPPSPAALAGIPNALDLLRRYPDPQSKALRAAVARRSGVPVESVFAGNGSDEVLALCFLALIKGRGMLRFPDVSYSFYPVWSATFEVEYEAVPLAADLALDLSRYPAGDGTILFPNPNAPTGRSVSRDEIEALLATHQDDLVIVDEAYVEFGAQSAVPLIARFSNLLVVQTLSKSHSLAGLRVGFALGHPTLVEGLDRIKSSFNSYPIDRIAESVAIAALEDEPHQRSCRDRLVATRESTTRALEQLGFAVLPSAANFVFARHPDHSGGDLLRQLRARDILVRHFDWPRTRDHVRITIGTDEEMGTLLTALRELLARDSFADRAFADRA